MKTNMPGIEYAWKCFLADLYKEGEITKKQYEEWPVPVRAFRYKAEKVENKYLELIEEDLNK